MAKDVITRFKLETTGFDSKIRQAAKDLSAYSKTATQAKEGFNQFTKANIDAAKALGTMATSTTNVKDRVKELVGAYNDAAKAYEALSDEQKQSDWAKALAGSLTQLQQRIKETKQEMQGLGDIQGELDKTGGRFGGLKDLIGGIAGKFGMSASMFTGIGAGVAAFGALKTAISGNIETALGFEKSMSQLSSLTGMVGNDLEKLKKYAIELGASTTLSASQVADAFKMIGSQQPQLLESAEALKSVTKNAITLSEAAGIELTDAAKTLSVSINQMGGDSNNAARFVNVLAAASQKGAGDIVWLGEAITKSGTTAKTVGTSYEELVANLEQLAKAGYDASTAGTALRSIIMNLEKQANDQFKPSVVGLTQAFDNLGKANLTLTEYQGLVGKMFAAQAKALADAASEAKIMREQITGTNIAEEQAKTNTDNLSGSLKSLSSAWEGLNLHINSSNGFLKTCVDWLKSVVTWADQAFTSAGRAQKKLAQLQGGGDGQPTKVDKQISALGGSNFKQQKYNATMGSYNHEIKVADYYLKRHENEGLNFSILQQAGKRFGQKFDSFKELQDFRDAMATMRDEYKSRATAMLKTQSDTNTKGATGGSGTIDLTVDVDNEDGKKSLKELQDEVKKLKKLRDDAIDAGDTKLRDQYNTQIKGIQNQINEIRGGTTTTTKVTPQERSLQKFDQAQKDYDQALQQAALEMKAGTINSAEAKKKELQAAETLWKSIGDAREVYDSPKLKEAQEKVEGKIIELGPQVEASITAQKAAEKTARELEQAQKRLADAQNELADAQASGDLKKIYAAEKKVETAQVQVDARTSTSTGGGTQSGPVDVPINISNLDAVKQKLTEEMATTPVGDAMLVNIQEAFSDTTAIGTILKTAIDNGINTAEFDTAGIMQKLLNRENIPDETIQEYVDQLNELLTEKLGEQEALKVKLAFDVDDKQVKNLSKTTTEEAQNTQKAWGLAAQSVNNMGSALNAIEDPAAKAAGTVLKAIADIALGFAQAAKAPDVSGSGWAWLAWLAAGTAAMATTISTVHSLTGFSEGGIVGGNSYSGDNVGPVMLDAGEVVLNRAQQGVLADALDNEGGGAISSTPYVTGEQIYLGLNNYLKGAGLGQIVTSNG